VQIEYTDFPGLFVITPKVFEDERGFFMETFNERLYREQGIEVRFVQDNHVRSETKGVLRGLHFQAPPSAQSKLVRVSAGAVMDVVVDIRKGSPTYGRWFSIELTAANKRQLFIPKGFAHAYLTLAPGTEFQYKVDAFYDPAADSGIRWNDPDLSIDWPVASPVLSEKDKNLPHFRDFRSPFSLEAE
jgi:dTDP-4-dehydrorhamnose 3,5-epimerase